MIPSALGHALTVRIGQALGRGDPGQARHTGLTGIHMGWGYALFSALLIGTFKQPITTLYTSDAGVQALAVQLLIYAAIFQLGDALIDAETTMEFGTVKVSPVAASEFDLGQMQ